MTSVRLKLTAIAAAVLALAIQPAKAAEKIMVAFPHTSGVVNSDAHIALSHELGYFAEEGLEVDYVLLQGGGVLIPQLAQKSVDLGWASPGVLVLAKEPGKDYLPVKAVYNWLRTSPWEYAVLADSPIQQINDLRGKKLGINFLGSGNMPQTIALLKDAGLAPGKDVELIPVGYGAPALRALTTGQVAAVNLFDGMHATFENMGTKLRRLPQKEKYASLFGGTFFAHEDTIKNRGKMIAGFGRAFTKGIVACEANPELCIKVFWKRYPLQKPSQGSEETKLANEVRILKARLERLASFPPGQPQRFGEYPAQTWQNYVDILFEDGQLKSKDVPLNSIYTNEFVGGFNDFDVEALRRQARAMR